MKASSSKFRTKERKVKKRPTELYHLWREGGAHWYYTSGDVTVSYGGEPYVPAALNRSLVSYDSTTQVSKMTIYAGYLEIPIVQFIAINPVEKIWVQIMRAHRDISPLEVDVIFIGQIKSVSFKGLQANAECVGFEHFLSMPIPKFRYQKTCNWQLYEILAVGGFDFGCRQPKVAIPATVTVDSTGRILSSSTFDDYDDGWFTYGSVEFGDEKRTIIRHEGPEIEMAYRMSGLVAPYLVDVYPGCDRRIETCRTKFGNIDRFFGTPWIPEENPATRVP